MTIAITDAEMVLMKLLWKDAPLTAREITHRLRTDTEWHRKTVNTLLSRLCKKLAIEVSKMDTGINGYRPLIEEDHYKRVATSNFVDHHFEGDIAPLVASFAQSRKLKPAQLAELQQLLESLNEDG